VLKDKKGVEHGGGFEWKVAIAVRGLCVLACACMCACACRMYVSLCLYAPPPTSKQMSEAGPRFKVEFGPNGSMHPPYVGGLNYDAFRAQTFISAPRAAGDADFEMHDLKALSAWHRCCHTTSLSTQAACLITTPTSTSTPTTTGVVDT